MDTKDTVKVPENKTLTPYQPEKEKPFPEELKNYHPRPLYFKGHRVTWIAPTSLHDALEIKVARNEILQCISYLV